MTGGPFFSKRVRGRPHLASATDQLTAMSAASLAALPAPLRPTDDDWAKMLAAHVHLGTKNLDNKMVRCRASSIFAALASHGGQAWAVTSCPDRQKVLDTRPVAEKSGPPDWFAVSHSNPAAASFLRQMFSRDYNLCSRTPGEQRWGTVMQKLQPMCLECCLPADPAGFLVLADPLHLEAPRGRSVRDQPCQDLGEAHARCPHHRRHREPCRWCGALLSVRGLYSYGRAVRVRAMFGAVASARFRSCTDVCPWGGRGPAKSGLVEETH